MATKMKMCTRHNKEHPVDDFPRDSKQHDRKSPWCKLAWREYREEKAGGKATSKKVVKKEAKPAGKVKTATPAKKTGGKVKSKEAG